MEVYELYSLTTPEVAFKFYSNGVARMAFVNRDEADQATIAKSLTWLTHSKRQSNVQIININRKAAVHFSDEAEPAVVVTFKADSNLYNAIVESLRVRDGAYAVTAFQPAA